MVSIATIPVASQYRFDAEKHIHLLNDQPLMGASTVVDALGKQLTYFASGRAVMEFGVPDPKVLTKLKNGKATKDEERLLRESVDAALDQINESGLDAFIKRCTKAYFAHNTYKKETAKEGTGTHGVLSHYIQSCINDSGGEPSYVLNGMPPAVVAFAEWAVENVKKFIWTEKNCYSEKLWVGGISDCGCLQRNNRTAIIDFKRKGCYFSQHVQVGGYAALVAENGLCDSEGGFVMEPWLADDLIVFPNNEGKTRIEPAKRFMQRFAEVVNIYKHQQEYEND
jgi:hypothetical protein